MIIRTIFILLLFCITPAFAQGDAVVVDDRQLEELSVDPTWQKLLHYGDDGRGEILGDDFFLSSTGRNDPKAELVATLQSYSEPWPENGNEHARCRFPARYLWLSGRLSLPTYQPHPSQCTSLEKWALFDDLQSVSFLLVSGYLGNPGSTFGHSMLKFSSAASRDVGLFDLSASYGALIPDNEPTWRYVMKGVFGGYQGSFSDRYYYTQDLVYSHTEFRDVWEYELILSEYEKNFLVFHIWEIVGRKFNYLFLTKNCAYRLSELLEMVTGESFLDNTSVWYIPVETFHRLNRVDAERREDGRPGLIRSIRFIPSSQRQLNYQVSLLNSRERQAIEAIIASGPDAIDSQLSGLKPESRPKVLEAALAYYNYQLVKEQPEPSQGKLDVKASLLLERLKLPAAKEPLPQVPELSSPASGSRPMLLALGGGHDSNEGNYYKFRLAPFSQEATGNTALEGSEIALLDFAIGLGGNHHRVFAERVDLIRILKLKNQLLADEDESPWSWRLRVGSELSEDKGQSRHDHLFRFGVGHSWQPQEGVSLYAMADGAAHALFPHLRIRPHLGILVRGGSLNAWFYGGVENSDYKGGIDPFWSARLQYFVTSQVSLTAEASGQRSSRASGEFRWHW